jgi:V/A-type H+-transporting ATPase subunit I
MRDRKTRFFGRRRWGGLWPLRPRATRWFEAFVPREQTVVTLEALAASGLVELQRDPGATGPLDARELARIVESFNTLRERYADRLPGYDKVPSQLADAPEQRGRQALAEVRDYLAARLRLERRVRQLRDKNEMLILLLECLTALDCAPGMLDRISHSTEFLYKGVFACSRVRKSEGLPEGEIDLKIPGERHDFIFVAALPAHRQSVEQAWRGCRRIKVPDWLTGTCYEQQALVQRRLEENQKELAAAETAFADLRRGDSVAPALNLLATLRWFVDHAPELVGEEKVCHVTGWTAAEVPEELQQPLENAGIEALVRFARPPPDVQSPVWMRQFRWASPFRIFLDMLGTPDQGEIDPSPLLPVIVPVLFGFMFPDIGHGLVLVVAGLALAGRRAELRILVPCGISAMVFGLLFGDVFGREDVVPALWFHPMDHPLWVLGAALLFGCALILLGSIFSAVEAYWRGELARWLVVEGAAFIIYAGGLLSLAFPEALITLPVGLIWYLLGSAWSFRHQGLVGLGRDLGQLLHSGMDLALHTLSFVRVGAFALAHAGFSEAVNQLAAGVQNPMLFALIIVLGHVMAMLIETLIVFIQTTRLVLFEFFIRFLRAEGRVFRPISPPTASESQNK